MAMSCGAIRHRNRRSKIAVTLPIRYFIPLLLIVIMGVLPACGSGDAENTGALLVKGSLSGLKGRIAFQSRGSIYTIDADGSHLTHLTQGGWPSWSPDGVRIAFASSNTDNTDIYVMHTDGPGVMRLTTSGGTAPSWSPDGKRISYTSGQLHKENLNVMNADGSNQRQLATEGGYWSDWSPNGTQVAFRCHDLEICVINTDGSNWQQLTTNGGGSPAWSPDGIRLAFAARDGIYLMNADGSALIQLAHPGSDEDYPIWSPDGTRIAFVARPSNPLAPDDPHDGYGLYVMHADGSVVTRLTKRQDVEVTGRPIWSPDGSVIAFMGQSKQRSDSKSIYIVKVDGSAMTQLVMDGNAPVWQP